MLEIYEERGPEMTDRGSSTVWLPLKRVHDRSKGVRACVGALAARD